MHNLNTHLIQNLPLVCRLAGVGLSLEAGTPCEQSMAPFPQAGSFWKLSSRALRHDSWFMRMADDARKMLFYAGTEQCGNQQNLRRNAEHYKLNWLNIASYLWNANVLPRQQCVLDFFHQQLGKGKARKEPALTLRKYWLIRLGTGEKHLD